MNGSTRDVLILGEGMIELSETNSQYQAKFGGDTLNTAIYLSRLGGTARYCTGVGRDPFSSKLIAQLGAEGVKTDSVFQSDNNQIGIYLIQNDKTGEREFFYWRNDSAARAFFQSSDFPQTIKDVNPGEVNVYLSGITLSLLSEANIEVLSEFCEQVKSSGGEVIFDTNYRRVGWGCAARARKTIESFASLVTLSLPTFEDAADLFGDKTPEETAQRWRGYGADTVIVKAGSKGAYLKSPNESIWVPTRIDPLPLDTTGAGDSFNAAIIASLVKSESLMSGVKSAHNLASVVIRYKGAIAPSEAMPADVCAI